MLSLFRRPVLLAASVALAATVGTPAMADPVAGPHVAAYGWGGDYDGQLGDGTRPRYCAPTARYGRGATTPTAPSVPCSTDLFAQPAPVPGLTAVAHLSAGFGFMLVITTPSTVDSIGATEGGGPPPPHPNV